MLEGLSALLGIRQVLYEPRYRVIREKEFEAVCSRRGGIELGFGMWFQGCKLKN